MRFSEMDINRFNILIKVTSELRIEVTAFPVYTIFFTAVFLLQKRFYLLRLSSQYDVG